jgi:hypothetical protein
MDISQSLTFLDALGGRRHATPAQCLTLTAIHPDRNRPSPSRHVPLGAVAVLEDAVTRLLHTNTQYGYGAYVGIATRRPGLTRWQRGGAADLIALPVLWVDIDREVGEAWSALRRVLVSPSLVVLSGAGVHAYWLLRYPIPVPIHHANCLLHTLAQRVGGDTLTVAHCMRLPGSRNTKPGRGNAMCQLHTYRPDVHYDLSVFNAVLPPSAPRPHAPQLLRSGVPTGLNPALIAAVADLLRAAGYRQRGDWLNGACPYPARHKHHDAHRSFGFHTRSGYGYCFVCSTFLLRDLCAALGVNPTHYGGLVHPPAA